MIPFGVNGSIGGPAESATADPTAVQTEHDLRGSFNFPASARKTPGRTIGSATSLDSIRR